MKKIEVVAAIIQFGELILCVQRDFSELEYISNKFEFPGGKIEFGETKIEALRRELIEELDIEPNNFNFYISVIHQYPDFELTMHSFTCDANSLDISLNEHISYQWLSKNKLIDLEWAAADIPIVKEIINEY